MSLFNNPAKDAKKIQETIDYRVLKAAWDCVAQINVGSTRLTHKATTPAWFALFAIQNYKGDFSKFDSDELHLLKALTDVHSVYGDIIELLESRSRDEDLGRHILNTNPVLQEIVPAQYDNALMINEYIIQVINNYKKLLDEFYTKYQIKIDKEITRLGSQI